MAKQKNVSLVSGRVKLVLNPRPSDEGKLYELDAQASKTVRKMVADYVQADSRELPYDERLKANKRVGMKQSNKLAKQILAFVKGINNPPKEEELELEVASTPSIEDAMAEAEVENARRDAISDQRLKAIQAELSKAGLSVAGL